MELPKEEVVAEVIPDGFVKTRDGAIIPRTKVMFAMQKVDEVPDPKDKKKTLEVFKSNDGITIYAKGENGNMLRVNGKPKLSKAEKKAAKRSKHKGEQ